MAENKRSLVLRILTALIGGPLFLVLFFCAPKISSSGMSILVLYILVVEWQGLRDSKLSSRTFWTIISVMYPGIPLWFVSLLPVILPPHLLAWGLYPYAVAWGADTGGYIVGRLWGRHKMAPVISPGKTWEGFCGGYAFVLALHAALFRFSLTLFIAATVLFLAAVGGDLLISYFKRRSKIKDTGGLLPGHGGLLDRFDSVAGVGAVMLIVGVLLSLFVETI